MTDTVHTTATKRTAGWVVLETLANYGIDTVFGIPGTHNLELYRPLPALGVHNVTARHEQGAGYAADAWSQRTGKPAVVLTTSGPGLLNALSAAGTAYCESRPMLILAPGPALGNEFADRGTLHETKDQLSAARAIVEWGRRVTTAEAAVEAVHDAFELFATGRPRPVYIEIPLDVLEAETEVAAELLTARDHGSPAAPDTAAITRAAELLAGAADPVILAGGGSRRAGAELRELAELLHAPVVTTGNGKGTVSEHDPLSLGANLRLPAIRSIAQQADVLLVVGSKLGEADLWVDRLEARGQVIRIDLLESQLTKNQDCAVGIVGDAAASVAALIEALKQCEIRAAQRPLERVHARVAAALEQMEAESRELDPVNTELGKRIAAALPADAIVTTDSSQIAYWGLLNMLRVSEPNSTLYMPTYATLGYGTPAGIGAKLASPDRPVVTVTGDGALMFSLNEFITAVEERLDLVVIVVDNGGYQEIEQNEAAVGIAPIAVRLTQPDWAALATACGGKGRTLEHIDQLPDAVAAALAEGGLQLIHIDEDRFAAELKRSEP